MAKKKKKQGLKNTLIYLGTLFTIILFILKVVWGRLGWLDVFAPLLIAFLLIFLLSVLKTAFKKA